VENVEPARIVETTADKVLEEIRQKQAKLSIAGVSMAMAMLGFGAFALAMMAEGPFTVRCATLCLGIVGLVAVPWGAWWDRRTKLVHIRYDFDPLGEKVQEGLKRLLAAFQSAHAIWSVQSSHDHGDWKRNAGAGTSVGRRRVYVRWGAPPIVRTNAHIGCLDFGETQLYFFPDRLLIFGPGGVRAASYAELAIQAGTVDFIESEAVPRDARVVGTTWRFVNKGGGPDRRFANNCQLPVVSYGTIELSSSSGLRMSIQTSTDVLASGARDLLRVIQAAIRDLESRNAIAPLSSAIPAFKDDPPPLLMPAQAMVRSTLEVLSFRWLAGLPNWAVPIAWGLIFSLPPVAILVKFSGAGGRIADLFLFGAIIMCSSAMISLTLKQITSWPDHCEKASAARRSRFHALLMSKLRTQPTKQFNFTALVEDAGLPRVEADQVADEVFRRIADRIVMDGLITHAERTKLDVLARVLEMDAARAGRIEDEAKSNVYRRTVAEALADGTLTQEAARKLNELRVRLDIDESPWTADDIVC
jgi:hypothetical protein